MAGPDRQTERVFFGGDRGRIPYLTHFTRVVRRAPERAGRRRQDRQWSVDYHVGPAGEYSLDGRHWHAREAGTAHLYSPGRTYWERSAAADVPFQEMYVLFTVEDARELEGLVGERGFSRFLDPDGLLAAVFRRLSASETPQAWRGQAALYELLDLLMRSRPLAGSDRLVSAGAPLGLAGLARRVEDEIRANYHRPLSLASMARAAGVSVSTLTHRYRTETGQAPIARLIEYRLDVARGMLLKGASLKAVAAQTGFYDEFHLSKAFKQRFGMPPRRYARERGTRA